jgi:hypothetical protein
LFCHGCSSQPNTKYFYLTIHYFNAFAPIAQRAGQAAMLGRLSLSLCLWFRFSLFYLQTKYKETGVLTRQAACEADVGKHPDLMVGLPTSTVFPTNDRKFEISQFFRKKFEKI